ncbi:MAG: hypothetical protein S4CHLAM81_01790 [Chlamydiales bacterium]|nr:hypothetical protein [Chlamydiales bacterium]MCH9634973.1 hypothetical protein [Chlamydiales bacterium]
MNRTVLSLLLFLFLGSCHDLFAATSSATVNYMVGAIDEIEVSGNPRQMVVASAKPGEPPSIATDSTTTYAVTTNSTGRVITASLNRNLPAGCDMCVQLVAPTGAISTGDIHLTTDAQNVVTGISNIAESGLPIIYRFAASCQSSPGSGMVIVTFTISP